MDAAGCAGRRAAECAVKLGATPITGGARWEEAEVLLYSDPVHDVAGAPIQCNERQTTGEGGRCVCDEYCHYQTEMTEWKFQWRRKSSRTGFPEELEDAEEVLITLMLAQFPDPGDLRSHGLPCPLA